MPLGYRPVAENPATRSRFNRAGSASCAVMSRSTVRWSGARMRRTTAAPSAAAANSAMVSSRSSMPKWVVAIDSLTRRTKAARAAAAADLVLCGDLGCRHHGGHVDMGGDRPDQDVFGVDDRLNRSLAGA